MLCIARRDPTSPRKRGEVTEPCAYADSTKSHHALEAMPMMCPFCLKENALKALVCDSCSRDIAVPEQLIAERDELVRKRDLVRRELLAARAELEQLRRRKNRRLA